MYFDRSADRAGSAGVLLQKGRKEGSTGLTRALLIRLVDAVLLVFRLIFFKKFLLEPFHPFTDPVYVHKIPPEFAVEKIIVKESFAEN